MFRKEQFMPKAIHAAADSHTFRTTEKMFYKILDISEHMCYNIIKGSICPIIF